MIVLFAPLTPRQIRMKSCQRIENSNALVFDISIVLIDFCREKKRWSQRNKTSAYCKKIQLRGKKGLERAQEKGRTRAGNQNWEIDNTWAGPLLQNMAELLDLSLFEIFSLHRHPRQMQENQQQGRNKNYQFNNRRAKSHGKTSQ